MLEYFFTERLDEFDFFIKVDGDSYLNIERLIEVLVVLENPRKQYYYFGEPGEGIFKINKFVYNTINYVAC